MKTIYNIDNIDNKNNMEFGENVDFTDNLGKEAAIVAAKRQLKRQPKREPKLKPKKQTGGSRFFKVFQDVKRRDNSRKYHYRQDYSR